MSQVLSGSAGDAGSWKQKEAGGRVVRKCERDPRGSGRAATKSATDKYDFFLPNLERNEQKDKWPESQGE